MDVAERELGHWMMNYLPAAGGRFNGRLAVTDQAVVFESRLDMGSINDQTLRSLGLPRIVRSKAGELMGSGVKAGARHEIADEHFTLRLHRPHVLALTTRKRRLFNQIVVIMDDGDEHVFEYGLLSVKNVVAAWQSPMT